MPLNSNQKPIVKAIAGSHLFGLNTPTSDVDYKGVFQESLENIILGTDSKNINITTNKSNNRNTVDDVDIELKELRTFIKDCMLGQTYACELLFTPKEFILETSTQWEFIQDNKSKLIPNNLAPFIGYAFGQSQKYSLRGVRLEELQRVIAWFEAQNRQLKLEDCYQTLQQNKYTYYEMYKHTNNTILPDEARLNVLGMIFQLNKPVKECLPTLKKRLDQYGERSKLNMDNGGVDWKAYSHAFRLIYEWEQLLVEQQLTFPVPQKDFILSVKKGEMLFEELQDKLFDEFERVKKIPNNLPEPDRKFWNNWLINQYRTN